MSDSEQPVPELRSDVDATKLNLSVDEYFVMTRIDGRTPVDALSKLIGKSVDETVAALTSLAEKSAIVFGDVTAKSTKPKVAGAEGVDYDGFVFPPNLMAEECGLTDEERKRVIFNHEHLKDWTYYELLGINHKADAKGVKKAYFRLSKEWHPDRWRRKKLGTFGKMIESIYKQINEGYKVLSTPDQRKAYDETIVFDFDEDDLEKLVESQRDEDRQKRHDVRMRTKRKRSNPVRKRLAQAKKFYEQAIEYEGQNRIMDALRAAQMSVTYDDKREAYQELVKRLSDMAGEHKIGPFIKRGKTKETMLDWPAALEMYSRAIKMAPNNGEARLRMAYTMLMAGEDASEAMRHIQKAVQELPDEPEAHYVLGRLYDETGLDKMAKAAYERAVKLKPNYQEAKKRLKRMKWGF